MNEQIFWVWNGWGVLFTVVMVLWMFLHIFVSETTRIGYYWVAIIKIYKVFIFILNPNCVVSITTIYHLNSPYSIFFDLAICSKHNLKFQDAS